MKLNNLVNKAVFKPKKIGIFGYIGVGKTTYLACLYHQLQQDAYPKLMLGTAYNQTNNYLMPIINKIEAEIERSQNDEMKIYEAANAGSLVSATSSDPINIEFKLSISKSKENPNSARQMNHFILSMQDYMGEMTTIEKMRQNIGDFIKSCDGLLIFLSPELVNQRTFKIRQERYRELRDLISFIEDESADIKINVPTAIVITKIDKIRDIIEESESLDSTDEYIDIAFSRIIKAVKSKSYKGFNLFQISSIESYVFTHINDFGENVRLFPHRNLASPIEWLLTTGMANYSKMIRQRVLSILMVIIFCVFITAAIIIRKANKEYKKVLEFELNEATASREAAKAWKNYLNNYYSEFLYFPRITTDSIINRIAMLNLRDDNETYRKVVEAVRKNENNLTVISEADNYKKLFPEGTRIKSVDSIREVSLYKYVLVSKEKGLSPKDIVGRCKVYIEQSEKKLYLDEVTKINSKYQKIIDDENRRIALEREKEIERQRELARLEAQRNSPRNSGQNQPICSVMFFFPNQTRLHVALRYVRDRTSHIWISRFLTKKYYSVISPTIIKLYNKIIK